MNNNKETIETLVKLLSEAYDREKVLNERIQALEEANRMYESSQDTLFNRVDTMLANLETKLGARDSAMQNTQGKEFLENMAVTFANRKTFSPTEKINLIKEYRTISGAYLKDCVLAIEKRFNELCITDERDGMHLA